MLPGFRFLFAAVVLSMSVLIFGLGAASLLRTAHEEFANLPTRRVPPTPAFPRSNDSLIPTLAMLRVDPPVVETPVVAAAAVPDPAPDSPAAPEQGRDTAPAEPEKLSALKPEEPAQSEAAKPEVPAAQTTAETPAPSAEQAEAPVANTKVKLAAAGEAVGPSVAAALPFAEPAMPSPSLDGNAAATRIATLGGPAVTTDTTTSAGTTDAKADAAKKRAAQQARERKRAAARRVRLAREASALAIQQQKAPNPFEQGLLFVPPPVPVRR